MFLTKSILQCGICQRVTGRCWQRQRLHCIAFIIHPVKHAEYFVSPLNYLLNNITFMWYTHFAE
ncbi:hypothetical protein D3C78_1562410 [compost metagenome]